ncbi:hypothetical protein NSERUTF1_1022 [Nocardia seriolae]|nr:hypothetical protein NSERUTF1_1022 [Nocardia seriolae]
MLPERELPCRRPDFPHQLRVVTHVDTQTGHIPLLPRSRSRPTVTAAPNPRHSDYRGGTMNPARKRPHPPRRYRGGCGKRCAGTTPGAE